MQAIISRQEALAKGLTHYFTGKACKNAHSSKRLVFSRHCVDCQKARSLKWRIKNPDKKRASYQRWKENNPDKVKSWYERWWAENADYQKARQKKWRKENLDIQRASKNRWRAANPEKRRTEDTNRRARKKQARGKHTAADVKRILRRQGKRCVYCKASLDAGYHVDHIVPLAKGGSNGPDNLQCLCPTCNLSKGAKMPEEFARSIGMLL